MNKNEILFYYNFIIFTLNWILLILASTVCGEKIMKLLYDLNKDYQTIDNDEINILCHKYKTDLYCFRCISQVPFDNAVATDNFDKKLTLILFEKKPDISQSQKNKEINELVFQNLDINVGQDNAKYHLPIINQNTIGYASERNFYLIDLKNNAFKSFIWVAQDLDEYIKKVSIADAEKMHFIFYIKRFLGSHRSFNFYMRLVDCSGKKAVVLKEIQTYVDGNKDTFIEYEVIKNKIALFEGTIKSTDPIRKISILDSVFNTSTYQPLETFFSSYKEQLFIGSYTQHPYFPFSVVREGEYDKILLLDNNLKNYPLIKLYNNAGQHSFSPDGKWLISQIAFTPEHRYKFYLFPVSNRYPFYIGTPVFCGLKTKEMINPNNIAWTTHPLSLVVTNYEGELFRIALENDENEATTAGKDLHDYIVDFDLNKNKDHFDEQREFLLTFE